MAKYRKKPVVIEAYLPTHHLMDDGDDLPEWLQNGIETKMDDKGSVRWAYKGFSITTLEGIMDGDWGDWIIQGVQGELYPCKPDIFAATYELESESHCTWKETNEHDGDGGVWELGCNPGVHYSDEDGNSPSEANLKFCYNCGKEIEEVELENK